MPEFSIETPAYIKPGQRCGEMQPQKNRQHFLIELYSCETQDKASKILCSGLQGIVS